MNSDKRLTLSLRLKAARWLCGRRGEGKSAAQPLSTSELANFQIVKRNGITRNRIEDIEQMTVDAREMEIRVLEDALGLDILDAPPLEEAPPVRQLLSDLEQQIRLLRAQIAARDAAELTQTAEERSPSRRLRRQPR